MAYTDQQLKWVLLTAIVVSVLVAGVLAGQFFHASILVCQECRFQKLPSSDRALKEWIERQRGVVAGTVGVGRSDTDKHKIYVAFIQSRNLFGKPVQPDLDERVKDMGYENPDSPFRTAEVPRSFSSE